MSATPPLLQHQLVLRTMWAIGILLAIAVAVFAIIRASG